MQLTLHICVAFLKPTKNQVQPTLPSGCPEWRKAVNTFCKLVLSQNLKWSVTTQTNSKTVILSTK